MVLYRAIQEEDTGTRTEIQFLPLSNKFLSLSHFSLFLTCLFLLFSLMHATGLNLKTFFHCICHLSLPLSLSSLYLSHLVAISPFMAFLFFLRTLWHYSLLISLSHLLILFLYQFFSHSFLLPFSLTLLLTLIFLFYCPYQPICCYLASYISYVSYICSLILFVYSHSFIYDHFSLPLFYTLIYTLSLYNSLSLTPSFIHFLIFSHYYTNFLCVPLSLSLSFPQHKKTHTYIGRYILSISNYQKL